MKTGTTGVSIVVTAKANCVGMVVAGLILTAGCARALMVVEDFEFYQTGSLVNTAGGSGFLNAWTTGNMNVTNGFNLTCNATGYAVTSIGTGVSCATSAVNAALSRRSLAAPIPGSGEGRTVWFSTLVRPTSLARLGWHFNVTTADRAGARAGFLVVGADFRMLTNGILISTGKTLTANTTHLILGSVLLKDAGDSTVNYWLDPADLTSTNTLGAPGVTFAASFTNSFSGAIATIGFEAYNDANGRMDALRISDGNGDAAQAFLDVTRATPKALFGPVQFGSPTELTNHFALFNGLGSNDWISADDGNYGSGGFLRAQTGVDGHHVYVPDSDGTIGGGNDVFGDCTIDYDMRANGSLTRMAGVFFLGTSVTSRSVKHWLLNTSIGANTNYIRAWYNRGMGGGGSVQVAVTNALNCSAWRHVRVDVRRVNDYTQVEARTRIWASAHDFRGVPVIDTNITYDAANSFLTDGEVGFSSYYQSGAASAEIDNVAVYRYGGAPDWYVPKGTLMRIH